MSDYGTSPFANPLPGASPDTALDPFAAPPSWATPAAPPPPPARSSALYDLRPLSLGEILDRTFSLYRKRFWLFAGISTVPAAFTSLFTLVSLISGSYGTVRPKVGVTPDPMQMTGKLAVAGVTGFVFVALYLVAYGLTQAATVAAVSAVYTGEETSIGIAWRRVKGKWYRYALIMLWQGWSAIWLTVVLMIPTIALLAVPSLRILGGLMVFVVLASFIYAPFAAIRNSLGVIASAIESLTVRQSMRRSKFLVSGHKARVLGIMLLVAVLGMVGAALQQVFAIPSLIATGPMKIVLGAALLVVNFCVTTLVTPVGPIGLCLFYIDERVRKEGFDIEILMLRGAQPPPPPPESMASPFTSELA